MKLTELTDQEVKTIYLIHNKINYHDMNQRKKVFDMLQKKELLHSEPAREYADRIGSLGQNETEEPLSCIFCSKIERDGDTLICPECLEQMRKRLKVVTGEKKPASREPVEPVREKFQIRWYMVICAIAVLLAITAGIAALIINSRGIQKSSHTEKSYVKTYDTHLKHLDLVLGESQPYNAYSLCYQILTKEEHPTNNYLITFTNEARKLEGIALQMNGQEDADRILQLNLMAAAGASLYNHMTIDEAKKLLEQMISQNGLMTYEGYQWAMRADDKGTYFLLIDENLTQQLTGENAAEQITNRSDLILLLGDTFDQAERLLGQSEAVVTENTRYFTDECISVIYDTDSQKIIYIDCDGSGKSSYKICGIAYGDMKEDALALLETEGLSAPSSTTDDTVNYSLSSNGQAAELSITFTENHVSLICISLL